MAKKVKGNGSPARAKLPAGFTSFDVGGGFGEWWDYNKNKTLLGKIIGFDSYLAEQTDDKGRVVKKKRGIMRVQAENGVTVNVGESAAIKEIFQKQKELRGKQIFMQFLGQEKFKKGKQTRKINRFRVAVK